ncbi:MAG: hypothetical protein ABI707_06025 [Ferruginibacter sp.]
MKKTFTLLAVAALLTSASFAQDGRQRDNNYGNDRGREVASNNHEGNGYGRPRGTYYFSSREKDMQIFSINREYNHKIESVKHKFFMGRSKKEQLVCSLELQRDAEIRSVIEKFNDRRNLYDARDNRHNDHDRRNNW